MKKIRLHIYYVINGEIKKSFKYWDLEKAESVLTRMGAEYWEIGFDCDPYLSTKI